MVQEAKLQIGCRVGPCLGAPSLASNLYCLCCALPRSDIKPGNILVDVSADGRVGCAALADHGRVQELAPGAKTGRAR